MAYKAYSVRSTVFGKATPGGQLLVNGLAYKAYSVRSTVFGKVTPGGQLLDIVMAYKAYSVRSTVFLKSLAGCQVTWYGHAGNARKAVIWPVPDVKQGIFNSSGFSASGSSILHRSTYDLGWGRGGWGGGTLEMMKESENARTLTASVADSSSVHEAAAEQALPLLNTMITSDSWTRKTGTTA